MKRLSIICIFILILIQAGAQEFTTGVSSNPVLTKYWLEHPAGGQQSSRDEVTDTVFLSMPFFDDFTGESPLPDTNFWMDQEAFINNGYPFLPANRGVATLDCFNSRGFLPDNASIYQYRSDSLTSRFIRLDSIFSPVARPLTTADSIYLSFYYQPGGYGKPPEESDSLILQFGYSTGNLLFTGYDSIPMYLSNFIGPNDTIWPWDTIWSPSSFCDSGLYVISDRIYTFDDVVIVPCDSTFQPEYLWRSAWNSEGMPLDTFHIKEGTYFKQVLIQVKDSAKFYQKDFRFRFLNYASLNQNQLPAFRSNQDIWNIDYVYLNHDRKLGDTNYRDISYVAQAESFLKRYYSMPYNQYKNDPTNELKNQVDLLITNLSKNTYNTRSGYHVETVDGLYPYNYNGDFCNLYPQYTDGYQSCEACPKHACPSVNYLFPLDLGDSAAFNIDYYIWGDFTPVDTIGDTLRFKQEFFNYYAYDDGMPELGYAVEPVGESIACQFSLNTRDTVRGLKIYFNDNENSNSNQYFDAKVWSDNNGTPGAEMYSEDDLEVYYPGYLSGMATYIFEEPVPVNGIFYIGIEQNQSMLNIGFDANNISKAYNFYTLFGDWYGSTKNGALMIRPILGKEFEWTGIDEETQPDLLESFSIHPNPNNQHNLYLSVDPKLDIDKLEIQIFNMVGQRVYGGPYEKTISVADFQNGIYMVVLRDAGNQKSAVKKLVITK